MLYVYVLCFSNHVCRNRNREREIELEMYPIHFEVFLNYASVFNIED